jgi:hypothetical protein
VSSNQEMYGDLFADSEAQGDNEGESPPAPEASPPPQPEPWRQEIEALKQQNQKLAEQMEERTLQTIAMLSKLNDNKQSQAPVVESVKAQTDINQLYSMVKDTPELLPHIIKRQLDESVSQQLAGFRSQLDTDMARKDTKRALVQVLTEKYGEDLRDPKSPILQDAARLKATIAPLLAPELVNTDVHDQIALIMAAGSNPELSGKRQFERMKSEEAARSEAAKRASLGGGLTSRRAEPEWTAEDDELAAKFGLDITKPGVKDRLMGYKKSQTLMGIRTLGFD